MVALAMPPPTNSMFSAARLAQPLMRPFFLSMQARISPWLGGGPSSGSFFSGGFFSGVLVGGALVTVPHLVLGGHLVGGATLVPVGALTPGGALVPVGALVPRGLSLSGSSPS